jgi:hypothetical protein
LELLDVLTIPHRGGPKTLEACRGDLTALHPDEAVDALVVSAFPDNYWPDPKTLIGALERKGVSVWNLSKNKAVDLRQTHSCWLSRPISTPVEGIRFGRILCFEPYVRGRPTEVVGDIFRSLAAFVESDPPIRTVAMPLVACGNQNVPVAEMITPLVDAAVNWMSRDFPLRCLKVVEHTESRAGELKAEFGRIKKQYSFSLPDRMSESQYDVFVSYSREDVDRAQSVISELRRLRSGIRVFYDLMTIKPGHAWQQVIYEAIENCRHFVSLFSPAYLNSKVCLEEFHLAKFCSREAGSAAIFPIYLYSAQLPAYMKVIHYADCREGDDRRLRLAASELLGRMGCPPD